MLIKKTIATWRPPAPRPVPWLVCVVVEAVYWVRVFAPAIAPRQPHCCGKCHFDFLYVYVQIEDEKGEATL